MTGTFITLEGVEGAGKSTQMQRIRRWLEEHGHEVIETREPGGTEIAELIRDVVLHGHHPEMAPRTELLLIFAARAQHVHELIRPALERGLCVLCDRFSDASHAYQGGGRGISESEIEALEGVAHPGLQPDLTLLLDLPVDAGLERASGRGSEDRFETESLAFLERARSHYLGRAKKHPDRFVVIDASTDQDGTWAQIEQALEQRL